MRTLIGTGAVAAILVLSSCSSGDDSSTETDDESTTTTEARDETTTTQAADESSTTTVAESEEISTTGLLEFLKAEYGDEAWVSEFDFRENAAGGGTIAVNHMGGSVQMYAGGTIDEATAIAVCEAVSAYVYEIDDLEIQVHTGGYTDAVLIVSRPDEAGSCAGVAA